MKGLYIIGDLALAIIICAIAIWLNKKNNNTSNQDKK